MSTESSPEASGAPGGSPATSGGRVVVSSVTGRPIAWHAPASASSPAPREDGKILPDRVAADAPEPGSDESNDARLAGDVPPHWGR